MLKCKSAAGILQAGFACSAAVDGLVICPQDDSWQEAADTL